jgi:hypothetical protein
MVLYNAMVCLCVFVYQHDCIICFKLEVLEEKVNINITLGFLSFFCSGLYDEFIYIYIFSGTFSVLDKGCNNDCFLDTYMVLS